MTVKFRPAEPDDFRALAGELPQYRCRCIAAEDNGRVIGIGGYVYRPDGIFASVLLTEDLRRQPIALHRTVARSLEDARQRGVREIFAYAQDDNPAAAPWLQRLGFERVTVRGAEIWVWRNKDKEKPCRAG